LTTGTDGVRRQRTGPFISVPVLKETNEQLVMLVGAVNGLVEMQTTELPVLQSALSVLQDIVAVQKRTDRKTLVIVVLTLAIVFLTAALIAGAGAGAGSRGSADPDVPKDGSRAEAVLARFVVWG